MSLQMPTLWESPQWMPSQYTVDFGQVPPGVACQRTLTIANVGTGNSNMDIELSCAEPWVSFGEGNEWVQKKRLSGIESDESMTIVIRVNPDATDVTHGRKSAKIVVNGRGHPMLNLPKDQTLEVVAEFLKRRNLEIEVSETDGWEPIHYASQRVQDLDLVCRNVPVGVTTPEVTLRLYENQDQATQVRDELIEIQPAVARTWLQWRISVKAGAQWITVWVHTANRKPRDVYSAVMTIRDKRSNVLPATLNLRVETVLPPLLKVTQESSHVDRIVAGKPGRLTLNVKNEGTAVLKIEHIQVSESASKLVQILPGYRAELKEEEAYPVSFNVDATGLTQKILDVYVEISTNHRFQLSRRKIPVRIGILPYDIRLEKADDWPVEVRHGQKLELDLHIRNDSNRDVKGLRLQVVPGKIHASQRWIALSDSRDFDIPSMGSASRKLAIDTDTLEASRLPFDVNTSIEALHADHPKPLNCVEISFLVKPKRFMAIRSFLMKIRRFLGLK